jgi:hypothetical protein
MTTSLTRKDNLDVLNQSSHELGTHVSGPNLFNSRETMACRGREWVEGVTPFTSLIYRG